MKFYLDIETHGLGGDFIIGGFVTEDNNYFEFNSWSEFLELLKLYGDKDNYIYAHNGGKYDFRYLFEYLRLNHPTDFNRININGHLVFSFKIGDKVFTVRDTFLFFHTSLKSLCKAFNIKDKKLDFDIKKWIKDNCPVTDELKEYLKYDCFSLKEIHEKFRKFLPTKEKHTIASMSFDILLNEKYKGKKLKKITKNFMSKEIENKVRKSYKGGRVEVYKRKGKNLYKYDVNSEYPYMMKIKDFPYGNVSHIEKPELCLNSIDKGKLGVVKVEIEKTTYLDIPLLSTRKNGKLIFPLGRWVEWITVPEYNLAKKYGYDMNILEGVFWEKKGKLFEGFITKYYKMKLNNSGAKRELAKRFMNSCSGKFAQRRDIYTEIIDFGEALDRKIFHKGVILSDGLELMKVDSPEKYNDRRINPIYSSLITAYARCFMFKCMIELTKRGYEIYYTDTDCLITDCPPANFPFPIDDKKIGYWDFEETINYGVFVTNKVYAIKTKDEIKIKAKGVPFEIQKTLSLNDYEKLLKGEIIKYKKQKVTGTLNHFKLLNTDKNKMIESYERQKKLRDSYDKREILKDNINTKPIFLER